PHDSTLFPYTTLFRSQALFLGAVSPANTSEYLYSAQDSFAGEGAALLRALGVDTAGRSVEATLTDFQRRGYLMAHVLDCGDAQRSEEHTSELQSRFDL